MGNTQPTGEPNRYYKNLKIANRRKESFEGESQLRTVDNGLGISNDPERVTSEMMSSGDSSSFLCTLSVLIIYI